MPPKLCRSCSSFLTSMTSGKPSRPLTKGYSTGRPMRRARAMNCGGVSGWSWKKMTRCSRKCAPDLRHHVFGQFLRQIDAMDLGAERAGNGSDFHAEFLPLLLQLDIRAPDDRAVSILLLAQERRHVVGRHRGGLEAERQITLLEVRALHRLLDLARKPGEHLARSPGRCAIADPGADVVARKVRRFREGRHVGHAGRAPRERNAVGLQP